MTAEDKRETKLIQEAQSGNNDAALEELIIKYRPLLKRAITNRKISGMDPEDLLQEATICFVKAIEKFDENGGQKFSTFVYNIVKQRIIDLIKKNSSQKSGSEITKISTEDTEVYDPSDINVVDDYISREQVETLRKVIKDTLSDSEKSVLNLYLQEMSYSEIAESLGVSTKKVDHTLSQIKKKLREQKELKELFDV